MISEIQINPYDFNLLFAVRIDNWWSVPTTSMSVEELVRASAVGTSFSIRSAIQDPISVPDNTVGAISVLKNHSGQPLYEDAKAQTHHESLYFPDGDLVIASSLQQGDRTLFRVHSALIAHHSPVFQDMLSFPAGGSNRESYDDAPLVLLPDDVEEITALIEVLYKPGYIILGLRVLKSL